MTQPHAGRTRGSPGWASGPAAATTGYLLALAGAHARRLFGSVLAERHISAHHLGVLMALSQLGATSQQQVSAMVGVDPRNTTPLVDALTDRGLLSRREDPEDRRRHLLELTDSGRALLQDLLDASARLDDELLGELDGAQRAALHEMLLSVLR